MKNILTGIYRRLDVAVEKTVRLANLRTQQQELSKIKHRKEKEFKNKNKRASVNCAQFHPCNICVIGDSEGEKREGVDRKIFEDKMSETIQI